MDFTQRRAYHLLTGTSRSRRGSAGSAYETPQDPDQFPGLVLLAEVAGALHGGVGLVDGTRHS